MRIQSINPATEELNGEFDTFTDQKVITICKEVKKSFPEWSELDVSERVGYIKKLAVVLKNKKKEYARLITIEMGKPITQSVGEIEKCALTAEYFADNSEKWLADEGIKTEARKSFVAHEPLGSILSIMPWNFPFWQALRFGIPALCAGNVSILRHSNTVPMCALAIEEAFKIAGFPENIFRTIITEHGIVRRLIRSNMINGVSITGSVEAGREIGTQAGKNIKKFVLELGGSDPFIVLKDADVELASKAAVDGRNVNSGQSCISAKRFIVVKEVEERFTKRFAERMKQQKVGNPMDEKVAIGPMANKHQLEVLEAQVKSSEIQGAKIVTGGKRVKGKGFFFEPTVMTNISKEMAMVNEEVFGPVAPVLVAKDEKQAIRMANDSKLGLGASVWTKDLEKGEQIARKLEVGMVFVNSIVKSDPRLPFGGIKESGLGRELSRYGLFEFTNTKSIVVN